MNGEFSRVIHGESIAYSHCIVDAAAELPYDFIIMLNTKNKLIQFGQNMVSSLKTGDNIQYKIAVCERKKC